MSLFMNANVLRCILRSHIVFAPVLFTARNINIQLLILGYLTWDICRRNIMSENNIAPFIAQIIEVLVSLMQLDALNMTQFDIENILEEKNN